MKKIIILFTLSLILFDCSKGNEPIGNSIKIEQDNTSLYPNQTYDIKAISNLKITYSSENNFYATVSNNGIITGGKVGTTNIILDNGIDKKIIKVTIISSNNLYPDPVLDFGCSESSIINKLGTPYDKESDSYGNYIEYYNAPITTYGIYYFFSNNQLVNVRIDVKINYIDFLNLYLSDRFILGDQTAYGFFYQNALISSEPTIDISVLKFTSYGINYYYVTYSPHKSSLNN